MGDLVRSSILRKYSEGDSTKVLHQVHTIVKVLEDTARNFPSENLLKHASKLHKIRQKKQKYQKNGSGCKNSIKRTKDAKNDVLTIRPSWLVDIFLNKH